LSGNVASCGAEKVDCFCDVMGGSGAGEWDAFEVFVSLGLGIVGGPFNDSGRDAVDGYVGGELTGQALGQIP
jgi:hypothetical protein